MGNNKDSSSKTSALKRTVKVVVGQVQLEVGRSSWEKTGTVLHSDPLPPGRAGLFIKSDFLPL